MVAADNTAGGGILGTHGLGWAVMTSDDREIRHALNNLVAVVRLQAAAARRAGTREAMLHALELIERSAEKAYAAMRGQAGLNEADGDAAG